MLHSFMYHYINFITMKIIAKQVDFANGSVSVLLLLCNRKSLLPPLAGYSLFTIKNKRKLYYSLIATVT